jgi:hypothetical protein
VGNANRVNGILGNLILNGVAAAGDVVNVNDQANPNVTVYTITANTVSWGAAANLTYNNVNTLRVNTGTNNDTVNVQGTAAGTVTTVNLGPGMNTVNVGNANRVNGILGNLILNGVAAAGDVINVNDQANPNVTVYTITTNTVSWGGAANLTYNNFAALTLNSGTVNNTINIRSTRAATTTTINLGPGNNTVTFGGNVAGVLDVAGPIALNNGGGLTALVFNDQANAGNTTYTITSAQVGTPLWFFAYANVASITLNGGSGNNVYNVTSTALGTATTVNTGAGVSVVTIGGPISGLFDVPGPLALNGGGGPTALIFNDRANAANTTYTITATAVSRPGWVFAYAGIASLVFNGGNGNDVYNIIGTALGTATTVNTGGGANSVNIGGPNSGLFDVPGPLAVNGGGGPAQLVFNDQANLFNTTYTITATAVSRPGWVFSYAGVVSLVFNGGQGNDVYNIIGTALGTATTVNTGGGANSVAIGGPNNGLFDVPGPLAVNGGGGPAQLVFNDQANRANTTYAITATAVSRPGWVFSYAGVVSLVFNGGNANDVYNVLSTALGTATTINAGVFNDIINIGGPGGGLSNIVGPLALSGGPGVLVLNFLDQPYPFNTTYTVTTTTIGRPGFIFAYRNVQFMNLYIGTGNDNVNIIGVAPGTTFRWFRP